MRSVDLKAWNTCIIWKNYTWNDKRLLTNFPLMQTVYKPFQYVECDIWLKKLSALLLLSQRTLRVLNISWLRLKRLDFVKELIHLERIISDGNEFFDANNLAESIAYLPVLISASFLGCPAQRQDYCYRNKLITASKSLGVYDFWQIWLDLNYIFRNLCYSNSW